MGNLNKNSFIRWQGAFNNIPALQQAVDDNVSMALGSPFIEISVLLNDSATYGINPASLAITLQDNMITPATWDPLTEKLKYYPPAGLVVGAVREIRYEWDDNLGNGSNEASVFIEITDRATGWRGKASTYVCEEVAGDNTGQANFTTLEKYYLDDNTPAIPADEKPNDVGDPDYIAPLTDLISCPLPGSTDSFEIWSILTGTPNPTITKITTTIGGIPTEYFTDVTFGSPQPAIISLAPGAYDSIAVEIFGSVVGNLTLTAFAGGGTQATSVSPTETITFLAVTISGASSLILYP